MKEVSLGYGKTKLSFSLPEANLLGILTPKQVSAPASPTAELEQALASPIGCPCLKDIVQPGEKIAIVISDITRPCPTAVMLPPLIAELNKAGIPDLDITVIAALGIHRPHRKEEVQKLLGSCFGRVNFMDAWGDDYREVGVSSRGTPFQVFGPVVDADRRICLGNIEYHYFVGYSGGAKAIIPGTANRTTIQANHRMMLEKGAQAGCLNGNPVRQDIEEIAQFLSIDFILNVVLDENKQVLKAFAGHYLQAHREGCRFLDQMYSVPLRETGDIVIASTGGFPKDINVYQAQKALDNARLAVKPGGIIIWAAECAEGLGEEVFAEWIGNAASPADIISRIKSEFQLGGHKAAAIAAVAEYCRIFMVSGLPKAQVTKLFALPFTTLEEALATAFAHQGQQAKVLVMPVAPSTLPLVSKD
ncbi:MAG: nickel-dependent lactate racemase [Bacillota bacterium]